MPDPAFGIEAWVDGIGERAVDGATLLRRRRPIDGGAHQRMAKGDARAELHQSVGLRRRRRVDADAEPRCRPPDELRLAGGLDRRREQQQPGRGRQLLDPPREALLDPVGHGQRARQAEPSSQLRRLQAAGELEQGERVPLGLGDDPVAHARIEPARGDRGEQLAGVPVGKPHDVQFGQALELRRRTGLTDREQHGDGFRVQPARGDGQRLGRRLVEPLGVLDDAQQRLLLGDVGQEAEHGEADQKAIRCGARGQPEGGAQRVALGPWQTIQPVEHLRSTEPMETGVRQLHLGLHAGDAGDATAGRLFDGIVEERRLADPRLAAEHQHAAPPLVDGREQPVESCALSAAVAQSAPAQRPRPHHR